jgi:hypothetical protein
MPDADAQHRPAAGQPRPITRGPSTALEALHARGEGAHPGDDETVGLQGGVRVAGHRDVGTDPGQRAFGRAEVARAVVQDDDLLHVCHGTWERSRVRRDSRR